MDGRINVAEAPEIMVSCRPPNPFEKANPARMPRPNSPFENTPHNAGVVSVALMAALVALLEMPTENGSPADLDRSHHTALRNGHGSAMLLTIGGAVAVEHIRHFELRAIHRPAAQKCWDTGGFGSTATGRGSRSRGLVVEHTLVVAIRKYRAVVARLR